MLCSELVKFLDFQSPWISSLRICVLQSPFDILYVGFFWSYTRSLCVLCAWTAIFIFCSLWTLEVNMCITLAEFDWLAALSFVTVQLIDVGSLGKTLGRLTLGLVRPHLIVGTRLEGRNQGYKQGLCVKLFIENSKLGRTYIHSFTKVLCGPLTCWTCEHISLQTDLSYEFILVLLWNYRFFDEC